MTDLDLEAIKARWSVSRRGYEDVRSLVAEVERFRGIVDDLRDRGTAAVIAAEQNRLREIERCAAGLVRTAHVEVGKREVVRQWWDGLLAALHPQEPSDDH